MSKGPQGRLKAGFLSTIGGRIGVAAGAVLLGAVLLGWLLFDRLVLAMMRPRGSFASAVQPAAPDYTNPAHWSALPEREDAADVTVPELPAVDQGTAAADVFYVHPTTYVGAGWNGPVDDPRLNADTDRVATRIQASAFNGCCAVSAPRYRQANGLAFSHPSTDGQKAIELAYSDVAAAFRRFLQRSVDASGQGRPFILAAHSQGTVLAYRLLREQIARQPPRERLIAAYLIGGPVATDGLAQQAPDIPICAAPEQTGCVVAWNARGPHYVRSAFEMNVREGSPEDPLPPPEKRLCVNPLTWRADGASAAAALNQGALFFDSAAPRLLPGFASALCRDGTLIVEEIGHAPRDFMSRLLDHALGRQNYHPIEYQIFFANLRANAKARVAAYLQRRATARPDAPPPP